MKVLFYGGCHADILRDLFRVSASGARHRFESLKNYELIESGTPVPYDYISEFDVVVYSPIARSGEYNTDRLTDFLDRRGIARLSYPWLEWRGYFTGISKKKPIGWHYQELVATAHAFREFDDFVRAVDGMDHAVPAIAEEIGREVARTSQVLRWQEESNATDIRVLDFIEENHRSARLFLTPDHPALALYKFVMAEIIRHTGLDADLSRIPAAEPQAGLRTPILPFVARALGLEFSGEEFEDRRFTNSDAPVPLREYLRILFHASRNWVPMEAISSTFLKASEMNAAELPEGEKMAIPKGTIVLFRDLTNKGHHTRAGEAFIAGRPTFAPSFLYPAAWRAFAWPAPAEAPQRLSA